MVAGQHGVVLLAGVRDGLELERGEQALIDDVLGERHVVMDVWRLHTCQAARLHYLVGVADPNVHCEGEKTH